MCKHWRNKKVEKQGSFGLSGQRNHFPPRRGVRAVVDVLEVRRLSAQTRAVVHDLAVDLFGAVINERHNLSAAPRYLNKLSISASVTSASGDFVAPA